MQITGSVVWKLFLDMDSARHLKMVGWARQQPLYDTAFGRIPIKGFENQLQIPSYGADRLWSLSSPALPYGLASWELIRLGLIRLYLWRDVGSKVEDV